MTLISATSQTEAPSPSAVESLLVSNASIGTAADLHRNLALHIAHNLRFQHNWTDLRLHVLNNVGQGQEFHLLSGQPPERLYIHPDEQIDLLQQQKRQGKTGLPELIPEREWVLPSHLREKWTLRRFGDVFDAIDLVPSARNSSVIDFHVQDKQDAETITQDEANPWRTMKRVLLATLDDDSTIVYYLVHDGIQKPRQN